MRIFGLTGGIATGKSTFLKMICSLDSKICFFDADKCVAELYQEKSIIDALVDILGSQAYEKGAGLNRKLMRDILFRDCIAKSRVEELVHPLVRKECLASLELASNSNSATLFIADIPLLFESGFDFGQDANLVIAVSRKTQEKRLIMRSGFNAATVHAILEAQLPISHKENCADVVFWNGGTKPALKLQIMRFIKNKYQ